MEHLELGIYDGCLFYRFEPTSRTRRGEIRKTHRRLPGNAEPNVERFMAQARDKLNKEDAVRLHKTSDEGSFLAMSF